MPDAAILNGTRRHPGTRHGKACAMIYSHSLYGRVVKYDRRSCEICWSMCNAGFCPREMALPRKRRVGVALRDGSKFGMASWIFVVFCSRASPRDAIPMALRLPRRYAPRNDTESGRFCLETDVLRYMRAFFCVVLLRIVFQTFRSKNRSVFLQNLPILSLRGGHFQCPTRQVLTERDGIPERSTAKPARCRLATNQNFEITSFCAPVLRSGMPYLWL